MYGLTSQFDPLRTLSAQSCGRNDGLGSDFYRDAAAISASFTHRFNSTMPLYFSAGYSNGGGTEHVGRAAVTFVW